MLQRHEQQDNSQNNTEMSSSSKTWGLTPVESFYAGMIAGAVSVTLTYPLDLVRSQLSVLRHKTDGKNIGFVEIMAENYHSRGFVGLFRGVTPTLFGILPYSGIAFLLNEQGKRKIQTMTGRDVTTTERMQCGAFSGLVAQFLAYPFEVVRRRMQTIGVIATSGEDAAVQFAENSSTGITNNNTKNNQKPSNSSAVIRTVLPGKPPPLSKIIQQLYEEQGIRGFFKGASMVSA
jgi:hypothetical protein